MFTVRVADNFHHMDRDEIYTHGAFCTWSEAVTAAEQIVDRSLAEHFRANMSADALYAQYTSFGDDPFIVPEPEGEHFSGWEYARRRCSVLCS